MAKANAPRKWIAQNYTCYGTGYCDLQHLLHYQSPDYYTCGVYGWNMDVYTFEDYAITTGYRGMINHIKWDSKRDREYDERARDIQNNIALSYEERRKRTNALLKEYLEKVFGKPLRIWE